MCEKLNKAGALLVRQLDKLANRGRHGVLNGLVFLKKSCGNLLCPVSCRIGQETSKIVKITLVIDFLGQDKIPRRTLAFRHAKVIIRSLTAHNKLTDRRHLLDIRSKALHRADTGIVAARNYVMLGMDKSCRSEGICKVEVGLSVARCGMTGAVWMVMC